MKSFLYISVILSLIMLSTACQKEFMMPTKEIEPDSLAFVMPDPDSARINFIWLKTNSTQIGARLELRNDTGAVLMNAIDMLQNNDTIFQFNANKGIHLKKYIFTVKTPTGSVLDTLHYNFTYERNLDEIIIERPNVKYYLQISWLHKPTIEN